MSAKEYVKRQDDVTLPMVMRAIHAVNVAQHRPTYVVVTDPDSKIGGFSARLLDSRHGAAWQVEYANGDTADVPVQWCRMRTS